MNKKIIILLGAPGSGKGTQGKFLANITGFMHASVGDMLRAMANSDYSYSEELKKTMSSGSLVSDELVNSVIKDFFSDRARDSGCVLDGYPRTQDQASYLQSILKNANIVALWFDITPQKAAERLGGRFICSDCSAIYNKQSNRPKKDGVCDECGGGKFISRNDDLNEDIISQRIRDYNNQTMSVIDFYKKLGKLIVINANQEKEKISSDLQKIVKNI